jgi:hypothetical protein
MKTSDISKEEAQVQVIKLKQEKFTPFCPLINAKCDHTCVCFKKASMTAVARSNMPAPPLYEIYPNRCTNAMFK